MIRAKNNDPTASHMFRIPKACLFLTGLIFMAACATRPDPAARARGAEDIAARAGWERMILPPVAGAAFAAPLVAFGPPAGRRMSTLRVYIEGDGFAWRDRYSPSHDPTPIDPVALKMAVADMSGDAVYLARPCQYAAPGADACRNNGWWTDARFSAAARDAAGHAIDRLKQRYSAQDVVLVGYSGGGALAALAAATRHDVARLVTVAGNLDTAAWVRHHRITPLAASLNPADFTAALARLPQYHFTGGQDAVMPPAIARSYVAHFTPDADVTVEIRPGYTHHCCWAESWPALLRQAGLAPRAAPFPDPR